MQSKVRRFRYGYDIFEASEYEHCGRMAYFGGSPAAVFSEKSTEADRLCAVGNHRFPADLPNFFESTVQPDPQCGNI